MDRAEDVEPVEEQPTYQEKCRSCRAIVRSIEGLDAARKASDALAAIPKTLDKSLLNLPILRSQAYNELLYTEGRIAIVSARKLGRCVLPEDVCPAKEELANVVEGLVLIDPSNPVYTGNFPNPRTDESDSRTE